MQTLNAKSHQHPPNRMASVITPQHTESDNNNPESSRIIQTQPSTQVEANDNTRGRGRGLTRGRGRGANRGSGRGRGRSRGRATRGAARAGRSTNRPDPSSGWTIKQVNDDIIEYEDHFAKTMFNERARIYYKQVINSLQTELSVRGLTYTRGGFVVLFVDSLLMQIMQWTNEKLRLKGNTTTAEVTRGEMYQYLAVLITSHTTRLSTEKTLELLRNFGAITPPCKRYCWINENILGFSPTGRGEQGQDYWNCQRDMTPNMSEMEQLAFRTSRKVYLHTTQMFATMDDDLFGTRSNNNQVKSISARKADREGHSADVIAEALSRVVIALRFRRRAESQVASVRKLLNISLEERGEISFNGINITADRGFGKDDFVDLLNELGMSSIFIMPDHILGCHPFVASSLFNPFRADELDNVAEEATEEDEDGNQNEEVGESGHDVLDPLNSIDRRQQFVVDDNPNLGNKAFYATKSIARSNLGQRRSTAIAVREHGTEKFCKVLRFKVNAPDCISDQLKKWLAVPKENVDLKHTLFVGNDCMYQKKTEEFIKSYCSINTIGQRCADWFVQRQFKITGTTAATILSKNSMYRSTLGLPSIEDDPFSDSQWFNLFCVSWFSSKCSTEEMKRGTENETAVVENLKKKPFIKAVFEIGLVSKKDHPCLGCSSDGIALVHTDEAANAMLAGDGDVTIDDNNFWVATVEVKTKISPASLGSSLSLSSTDTIFCTADDEVFKRYIPHNHMAQVIQQVTVLNVKFAIYVVSSETGVLYTLFILIPPIIRDMCFEALRSVTQRTLNWVYEYSATIPSFVDKAQLQVVSSRLEFWKKVYNYVSKNGPFRPLKLFKHSVQSFYSKTKAGVDGATQQRALLRSPSSHFAWEQKLLTQTLKCLVVNAFISWRMYERRDLLTESSSFGCLDRFRNSVNKVQSQPDFILDAALDLLSYAHQHDSSDQEESPIALSESETQRLVELASNRKKKRIFFFNSTEGSKLRLNVTGHTPVQKDCQYCVLCGQNKKNSNGTNNWRGHRSTVACNLCSVHLCVRKYDGLRKSCWEIWHSVQELRGRDTPKPLLRRGRTANTSINDDSEVAPSHEGQEIDSGSRSRIRTGRRLEENDIDAGDRSPSRNTRRRLSSNSDNTPIDSSSRNLSGPSSTTRSNGAS